MDRDIGSSKWIHPGPEMGWYAEKMVLARTLGDAKAFQQEALEEIARWDHLKEKTRQELRQDLEDALEDRADLLGEGN